MSRGIEMIQPLPLTMTFLRIRGCAGAAPGGARNELLGGSGSGLFLDRSWLAWNASLLASLLGVSSAGLVAFVGVGTGVFSDCALCPFICCAVLGPDAEFCLTGDGSGSAYLEAIILPTASFSSLLKCRQKSCWFRVLLLFLCLCPLFGGGAIGKSDSPPDPSVSLLLSRQSFVSRFQRSSRNRSTHSCEVGFVSEARGVVPEARASLVGVTRFGNRDRIKCSSVKRFGDAFRSKRGIRCSRLN